MPWIWTREAASAFNTIREKLTSLTVLAMYDPALPLFLACDASDKELGACIFQHNSAGQEQVFEYASKTLTKAERNYSQIEKEELSIIYGVQKFRYYLYWISWKQTGHFIT